MPVSREPPITAGAPADAWGPLRADAARRSGSAAEALRVLSVAGVTWPDTSLGCPEPGRLYAQVLTPGHRVTIVEPSGQAWVYHTSSRGAWVWCPAHRAQPPVPREADPRR